MNLLDLPLELFEGIFEYYVKQTDLEELFRTREVCKIFSEVIMYKVLVTTPGDQFLQCRQNPSGYDAVDWLKNHIGQHALYHCLTDQENMPALLRFVVQIVQDLMPAQAFESDRTSTLARCLKDLNPAILANNGSTSVRRSIICNWALIWSPSEVEYIEQQQLDDVDAVAVAAVVGDWNEFDKRLIRNSLLLEEGKIFGNPLAAAAAAGHAQVLESLLHQYYTKFRMLESPTGPFGMKQLNAPISNIVKKAIEVAAATRKPLALKILMDFYMTKCVRTPAERYDHLFYEVIQGRCVGILETIVQHRRDLGREYTFTCYLNNRFESACRNGHEDVVRYLLQAGLVSANPMRNHRTGRTDGSLNPLLTAVTHCQVRVASILLEFGADIKQPNLLYKAITSKKSYRTKFRMAEFLLDNGAAVDEIIIGCAYRCAQCINNRNYVANRSRFEGWAMIFILTMTRVKDYFDPYTTYVDDRVLDMITCALSQVVKLKSLPTEPLPFMQRAREIQGWWDMMMKETRHVSKARAMGLRWATR